jgi:hypothetical protein
VARIRPAATTANDEGEDAKHSNQRDVRDLRWIASRSGVTVALLAFKIYFGDRLPVAT